MRAWMIGSGPSCNCLRRSSSRSMSRAVLLTRSAPLVIPAATCCWAWFRSDEGLDDRVGAVLQLLEAVFLPFDEQGRAVDEIGAVGDPGGDLLLGLVPI